MLKQISLIIFTIYFGSLSSAQTYDDCQGVFIQTGERLEYFSSASPLNEALLLNFNDESFHTPMLSDESLAVEKRASVKKLTIDPPSLDFGSNPVGIAKRVKVTLRNPLQNAVVRMDAISGSTAHFHCSFFDEKFLKAGSSTAFEVVFLPRKEGLIKTTLHIHSSAETIIYNVTGEGVPSPFRLMPFLGVKVSLNSSVSSWLELYNPFPTALHVQEMYTSDSSVHLDLPHLVFNPSRRLWNVLPFRTKHIATAKVIGNRVRNASAFIRLKTDNPTVQHPIIIPVEIEVTSQPGLYAGKSVVNFGLLSNEHRSPWNTITVYNTFNKPVKVTNVAVDDPCLFVRFEHTIVASNHHKDTLIAKIAYDPKVAILDQRRYRSGSVKFFDDNKVLLLSVPYRVEVLKGQLIFNSDQLAFFTGFNNSHERVVNLTSTFPETIAIYQLSLQYQLQKYLTVYNLTEPVLLKPNSTMPVLTLKFLPQYNQKRTKASTLLSNVYLYTNLTKFAIPVRLFSGLLELTVLSSNGDVGELNFGQLNVGEKRSMFIRLANLNPLPVKLLRVTQDDVHNIALELLAVDTVRPKSTVEPFLPNHILDRWTENEELVLPAESFAFYKCTISAPARLLSMKSHLTFETEFQKLSVDIKYTVEKESKVSVPGTIILDNCFPGKISGRSIKVFSKLHHEVSNVRVYLDEKDAGFSLTPFSQGAVKIKPFQFTRLARLLFTPSNLCVEDECYVGFPLDTVDGLLWVKGLKLPANLAELDFVLFSKHWSLWTDMVEEKMTRMNTTVHLEAPSLKRISFPAQANLIWPRLIKQDIVYFPLTAVGNFSVVNLLLRNPSNHPIAVQIIPLAIYPNPSQLINLFQHSLLNSLNGFVEIDDVLMFSLRDSELYNPTESSPVPEYRKQLEKIAGISIPRFTLSFLLKPGAKLSAQLGFLPSDYQLRSSLLAIRNNLTGMEMVIMYGRGAKLELKIGNVLPQSNNLLMFEIQDRHLFDCETMQRLNRRFSSTFSVSRSLVARNSGELPLHVTNISINGHQCQNRGFRIVNCAPFTLEPNETRPFEIVFRPDFTMYWYDAQLQLTIQGYHYPLLYKLGASVPKEWIVRCYSALPRPSWEQLLYYCSVIALGFLMICVVASAYLEGDRSITCAFRRRQLAENRKLFDLNAPMLCDSKQHSNDLTGGGNFVPQLGTNHQATLLVQLKQGVVVWLGKPFGWTKWFRALAKVEQQQLCPTPATGEATVPQPKSVRKMVKNVDSGKCSTELHLKNGRFTTTRTTKPKQKKYLESASSGKNVDRTSTNHHAINPVENEQVEVEKSITKKSKKQQHAVDRKQSSNGKFEEATTVAVEEKAGEQQQQQQQQQHWNDNLHRETEEDWSHVTESSVSSDVVVVVAPQPCCPLELERLSSKEESSIFDSSPDQLEESNSVPEWDNDDDDAGGDEDDDIGGLSKTIDFDAEFEKLAEQTKAFSLIDKEAPVDSGDRWQRKMRQRRRQSHRQRCRASGSGPRRLSCSDSGSSSRATSRSDSPPAPPLLTDQLVLSGRSSATQSTTTAVSRPTVERNVRHARKINENLKTVVELPFHYNREETSITKAAAAPMVTATTTTPPPTAATGVQFQSTNVHHFGTRTFGTFPPSHGPSSAQPFYMQTGGKPLEISAVKKCEDWAGFELAPVIENLWDEDYEPWKKANSSNLWNNDITSASVNYPQQQQQQNSSVRNFTWSLDVNSCPGNSIWCSQAPAWPYPVATTNNMASCFRSTFQPTITRPNHSRFGSSLWSDNLGMAPPSNRVC